MEKIPKKAKQIEWGLMPPVIRLCALALLCLWLVGCGSQSGETPPHIVTYEVDEYSESPLFDERPSEEYTDFEGRVFERINNERIAHGLAPLIWHDSLAGVARNHSSNMAQMNFFNSTCHEGLSPSERITNAGIPWTHTRSFIMGGNHLTPESLTLPEDDVLLDQVLTHIGVGFYYSSQSRYGRYFTIEFIAMPIRPSNETMRQWERTVLDLTNDYRAGYGLPPLTWDDSLAQAARLHSADMAYNDFIAHEGSDGSTVGERITRTGWDWRMVKENVATGQQAPYIVVDSWINSPGHRANMLSEDVRYLGVGFYFLESSQAHFHWTQKFGTPR